MSEIKILQVESYHLQHLKNHYKINSNFITKKYNQLWEELMYQCNGIGDAWKYAFESYGGYNYSVVVIDDEILQKQWALENTIKYTASWRIEILLKQIETYKPDILFIHHMDSLNIEERINVKKKFPFIKLFMTWDGIGTCDIKKIEGYDLVLTCLNYVQQYYDNKGIKSLYLPLAFDSRVNERIQVNDNKTGRLTFIGSIALFNNGHFKRLHLLSKLAEMVPVDFYIMGISGMKRFVVSEARCLLKGDIRGMLDIIKLNKIIRQPAFGLNMFQIISNSSITLNIHIDAAKNEAANMRLFEATGVGTCLLTDYKQNLDSFFNDEQEIVTYKSFEESIEKATWLIDNPNYIESISRNGKFRTLNDHTYIIRLRILSNILEEMLNLKT